jgi:myo-inositol-hexaphosphate 3-phosphohydrolase
MKLLKLLTLGLAVVAICAWAADRFEVKNVKYYTTVNGEPVVGHIAVADDKLIFVDDTNPEMTFTVVRTGVKTTRIDNGRIVFELSQPVMIRDAQQSNLILALPDDRTREEVTTWVKIKK